MKITKIEEQLPKKTTLPSGIYTGLWGGFIIKVNYESKTYLLTTEEGIKGINIAVVVTIEDNVATFQKIDN